MLAAVVSGILSAVATVVPSPLTISAGASGPVIIASRSVVLSVMSMVSCALVVRVAVPRCCVCFMLMVLCVMLVDPGAGPEIGYGAVVFGQHVTCVGRDRGNGSCATGLSASLPLPLVLLRLLWSKKLVNHLARQILGDFFGDMDELNQVVWVVCEICSLVGAVPLEDYKHRYLQDETKLDLKV